MIIVGDFNIPLPIMERLYRQKINKKITDTNNMKDQSDLTVIYRTFQPRAAEYMFFSRSYRTQNR